MDGAARPGRKAKELSNSERENIVSFLLSSIRNGKLPKGLIKKTGGNYHVSRKCISTIWNKSVKARQNGNNSLSAIHNQKAGMRNILQYNLNDLRSELQQLPIAQRTTLKTTAANLKVSTTTILRGMKEGDIVSHTSALKPTESLLIIPIKS